TTYFSELSACRKWRYVGLTMAKLLAKMRQPLSADEDSPTQDSKVIIGSKVSRSSACCRATSACSNGRIGSQRACASRCFDSIRLARRGTSLSTFPPPYEAERYRRAW